MSKLDEDILNVENVGEEATSSLRASMLTPLRRQFQEFAAVQNRRHSDAEIRRLQAIKVGCFSPRVLFNRVELTSYGKYHPLIYYYFLI